MARRSEEGTSPREPRARRIKATGEAVGDRSVEVRSATPERWNDLVALFGERGACGGCWCMHWRLRAAAYNASKGDGNRELLRERLEAGSVPPGVLAYVGDEVAGWCSVGPRSEFVRLDNSRILAPVDDEPVWSIVCFFVDGRHRGRGLSRRLIEAAVELAADRGATTVEAYPVEPKEEGGSIPPVFAFTGLASAFRACGFEEVARRSPTRPIMRRRCRGAAAT